MFCLLQALRDSEQKDSAALALAAAPEGTLPSGLTAGPTTAAEGAVAVGANPPSEVAAAAVTSAPVADNPSPRDSTNAWVPGAACDLVSERVRG